MDPFAVPVDDNAAAVLNQTLKLEGFFPEFPPDQVAKIFPRSALMLYPGEFRLIEQGDTGRDIFIVCEGKVSVSKVFGDAGAQLAELGPGSLLGEIALIKEGVRSATVIVVGDSKIFRLVYADIQYLLENNKPLADHLKSLALTRLAQ